MGLAGLLGLTAGSKDDGLSAYLAREAQTIDTNGREIRLDRDFRSGRLFLLGEVHGIAHGQQLDLAFLKLLHRQAGVRVYLGEFDFAQAAAFDAYVNGGPIEPVEKVISEWRGRGLQWASIDFRTKLASIRAWNLELPPLQRIRILGSDEIQDRAGVCAWFSGLLASKRLPDGPLAKLAADSEACAKAGSLEAAAKLEDSSRVGRIQDVPLADALAVLRNQAAFAGRDERIAANAAAMLHARPGKKAHGLWGLYHVIQAPVNGTSPMALQLARQGIAVRSTIILNVQAEMMLPAMRDDGTIGFSTTPYGTDSEDAALVPGIEAAKAAAPAQAELTLFRLTGRGSPFPASSALASVGGRFGRMQPFAISHREAGTQGWAQYLVLSRKSAATKPWPEPVQGHP